MGEVRIRNAEGGSERGLGRRAAGLLLAPIFGLLLLLPLLGRWRRRRGWNWIRACGCLMGVLILAGARGHMKVQAAGLALAACGLLCRPLADPDAMQKIADKLGAHHVLRGGRVVKGLKPGSPMALLLTADELLALSPPERIEARWKLEAIACIEVDGREYEPQHIRLAKAPPQRDEHADHGAACRLTLRVAAEEAVDFEYRGVFARHLAEAAAHTIHECRERKTGSQKLRIIR
jgi:hypothetical protein